MSGNVVSGVPSHVMKFIQKDIPFCGPDRHTEPGFVLEDGTILIESAKDSDGCYFGGGIIDGMFFNNLARYQAIRNENGYVLGFVHLPLYVKQNINLQEKEHEENERADI